VRPAYIRLVDIDTDTQPQPSPTLAADVERDNARVGYQAAVSLMTAEGNLIWTRYGLMILAHTIILTAIGLTSSTPQPVKAIIFVGLSLVGLVLCRVWWLVNDVGFRYFFYWLFSARELEELHLSPTRTLSRGTPFTSGEVVTVFVGGEERQLPLGRKDRIKVVHASKAIIIIFGLLYVAFLGLFLTYAISPASTGSLP
jgi:hypothetical protein